ncbi:hypothetical protein [Methylorubrum extorquens]
MPLSDEWSKAAYTAGRNLGFDDLTKLPAEHWQRVLTNVETRMRMRGIEAPDGWREGLAEQVGREGEGYAGPES